MRGARSCRACSTAKPRGVQALELTKSALRHWDERVRALPRPRGAWKSARTLDPTTRRRGARPGGAGASVRADREIAPLLPHARPRPQTSASCLSTRGDLIHARASGRRASPGHHSGARATSAPAPSPVAGRAGPVSRRRSRSQTRSNRCRDFPGKCRRPNFCQKAQFVGQMRPSTSTRALVRSSGCQAFRSIVEPALASRHTVVIGDSTAALSPICHFSRRNAALAARGLVRDGSALSRAIL